jgi:hypothetical protein
MRQVKWKRDEREREITGIGGKGKKKKGDTREKRMGEDFQEKKRGWGRGACAYLKGVEAGLYLDSSCLYVFS